jgi:hypothetical protein
MRSHGLPPGHLSVFSLNPGEVSPVMSDETGHYIYKLVSKEVEPLEAVKLEITKTLRRQRLEAMVHQVEQPFTTDINHAYFGAEGKPAHNKRHVQGDDLDRRRRVTLPLLLKYLADQTERQPCASFWVREITPILPSVRVRVRLGIDVHLTGWLEGSPKIIGFKSRI